MFNKLPLKSKFTWKKSHTRSFFLGSMVCVLLMETSSVSAAESPSIRFATGNDFAPFADEGLPSGGLATEIVNRIFGSAGYKVETVFLPWKRGHRSTLANKFDGTFPYYRTASRIQKFVFSVPIFETQGRVYVAKNSNFEANSIEEFAGLKLCRALGYSIPGLFRPLTREGRVEVVNVPKPLNSLRMVAKNRCDFVVWNSLVADVVAKKAKDKHYQLRPIQFELAPSTTHLIVAKDHPDAETLIRTFNRGMYLLRKSGDYSRIVEAHLSPSSQQ